MQVNEAPQEQTQDQESEDPMQMLGKGLQVMVEGIQQSSAPDDVKKQAGVVQQDFQKLLDMLGGGGGGGSMPMNDSTAMGGGNPKAVPA